MVNSEATSKLRQAHASVAASGGRGPTLQALATPLQKLLGKGNSAAGRKGTPSCTFSRWTLKAMVDRLVAWPCEEASSRAHKCSFAHGLWIVANPCLEWIANALSGNEPLAWSPTLQTCSDLLHEDFFGIDDEVQEMDIQSMAWFASMLLESHLGVTVDMEWISDVMLSLVRSGLPRGQ